MTVQILEADGKPAFAVITIDEYRAMLELIDDAKDAELLARTARRIAEGSEQLVPSIVVDRLLAGESPLRVWREHRGLTSAGLAAALGVTPAHVSKLENGKGRPSIALLRRMATVLDTDLESLLAD